MYFSPSAPTLPHFVLRTSHTNENCVVPLFFFLLFIVYRPALRAKSDADIIRDAKREALGLPPAHEEDDRPRGPRMATDEQVMERFKKRMRK
jgi:hypothetical protein